MKENLAPYPNVLGLAGSWLVLRLGLQVRVNEAVHITHTGNPRWSPERLVRIYGAYMRFLHRHPVARREAVGLLLSALWLARGGAQRVGGPALRSGMRRSWSGQREQPPRERCACARACCSAPGPTC